MVKKSQIIPTKVRDLADVCGAGDSVISLAALGLALNLDMEMIADLSNQAGGQVCEKNGVVPVDKDQLLEAFIFENRFSQIYRITFPVYLLRKQ
jgi:bifunctional ADP-heptose synthase (sugar kinase/adenylyltransferase)